MDQNTRHAQGLASLNVWSANCQGHRQRQQRTEHKEHTPSSRIEIKISEPAENRTRAACLEGRESIDHATTTDPIHNS